MNNVQAKKSLGQNFLQDENILSKIANSFDVAMNDLVIEVGPGKGALTKYLVNKKSKYLGYELDERMHVYLDSYESERAHIVFADFLKQDLKQDVPLNCNHIYVIANIPYYITTPIIEHFLASPITINGMVLLVQKEVAHRFAAQPGSKDYGYFTVYLQHFFDTKILFDVPPSAFVPQPKVWSSVVKFTPKEHVISCNLSLWQNFLKQAFSQKRKTLKNNLKSYSWEQVRTVLEEYHYPETVRAEQLPYEVLMAIFQKVGS